MFYLVNTDLYDIPPYSNYRVSFDSEYSLPPFLCKGGRLHSLYYPYSTNLVLNLSTSHLRNCVCVCVGVRARVIRISGGSEL